MGQRLKGFSSYEENDLYWRWGIGREELARNRDSGFLECIFSNEVLRISGILERLITLGNRSIGSLSRTENPHFFSRTLSFAVNTVAIRSLLRWTVMSGCSPSTVVLPPLPATPSQASAVLARHAMARDHYRNRIRTAGVGYSAHCLRPADRLCQLRSPPRMVCAAALSTPFAGTPCRAGREGYSKERSILSATVR